MTQPPCLCHVPVGPRLDTVCPLHDGDSPVALPLASIRAAPPAIRSHRTQRETQRIEGAAPRAEGLDVARLAQAAEAVEQQFAWAPRRVSVATFSWAEYAERVAAEYARLSRPSDERVPESEEPR